MDREDIIRMAREAQAAYPKERGAFSLSLAQLERFAALVAAAEREACAKVCENIDEPLDASAVGTACAAAIRARSKE